jgi:hypothetical protein
MVIFLIICLMRLASLQQACRQNWQCHRVSVSPSASKCRRRWPVGSILGRGSGIQIALLASQVFMGHVFCRMSRGTSAKSDSEASEELPKVVGYSYLDRQKFIEKVISGEASVDEDTMNGTQFHRSPPQLTSTSAYDAGIRTCVRWRVMNPILPEIYCGPIESTYNAWKFSTLNTSD